MFHSLVCFFVVVFYVFWIFLWILCEDVSHLRSAVVHCDTSSSCCSSCCFTYEDTTAVNSVSLTNRLTLSTVILALFRTVKRIEIKILSNPFRLEMFVKIVLNRRKCKYKNISLCRDKNSCWINQIMWGWYMWVISLVIIIQLAFWNGCKGRS